MSGLQAKSNDAAIQVVLRRILVLNLIVAVAKLAMGFATGAISLVADGFHSLIDGLSNVVAIVAQWIAARPPDKEHPYGHRRFEAIATFIIGGFLLLVAWEVLKSAANRLLHGETPEVIAGSFAVLGVTLVVNVFVVWYERRKGKVLNSRILLADANHTFTDVLVSISVIISLLLVKAGIERADAVVALIIVLVIARMGWHIVAESVNVLVDAAPLPADLITQVALSVPQVEQVSGVRSRGAGNDIRVDMDVQVAPEITTDHVYAIKGAIQEAVTARFPAVSEVQITFTPTAAPSPDYSLRVRAAADALGLSVHEVTVIPTDGGLTLEMHVEVKRGLSLAMAHDQVSALEEKLMAEDGVFGVITHIEPAVGQGAPLSHSHSALKLRDDAVALAQLLYPEVEWTAGTIRLELGGYALTMHCRLPGSVSVEEAHHIAEDVETHIRADLNQIQRVTIHTEPLETP